MLKWLTGQTRSMYIARPDEAANLLIFRHPDQTIPRGAKLTVRADECALFYREGKFVDRLDAGTYLLDTMNVPFLGHLLVDPLTGGNHFIAEVYFISLNEVQVGFPRAPLAQCTDRNSRNVVTVQGQFAYSIAIRNPILLLNHIAGQSPSSDDAVLTLANGRLANTMRSIVGRKAAQSPVLDIVSNVDSESISAEVIAALRDEMTGMGLELRRILDLNLSLDASSFELLQAFGKQEAEIALQRKGAELANQPGFAEFNYAQGQRAALEGLGKGFSQGNAGFGIGTGFGGDLTRSPHATGAAPPARARGSILAGPLSYYVMKDGMEQGPFKARQVVNLAILNSVPLEKIEIRREDDPPGTLIPANSEPEIVSEFKRRSPG
jgi:membrane protease subunit (stomatin/prohibitin family)